MRPRYETPEDRARELALMKTVALAWRVAISPNPMLYELDGTVHLEGNTKQRAVTGFAELKHRLKHTWADDERAHGDYMISLAKWRAGLAYSRLLDVPCVLVVRWMCGTDAWTMIEGRPKRVTFSGRFDRDDEYDKEPCVRVELGLFRPLTDRPEWL